MLGYQYFIRHDLHAHFKTGNKELTFMIRITFIMMIFSTISVYVFIIFFILLDFILFASPSSFILNRLLTFDDMVTIQQWPFITIISCLYFKISRLPALSWPVKEIHWKKLKNKEKKKKKNYKTLKNLKKIIQIVCDLELLCHICCIVLWKFSLLIKICEKTDLG